MERRKIIVIDDDPKIRAMLVRSLSYAGHEVLAAEDGMQGFDLVKKYRPHLVILDIMLPQMDGYEVCQQIKESQDIPILMLTAREDVKDRVKGLDCGADDYLVKPFALEEMLARVRALLRRYRSAAQSVLEYADLKVNLDTYQVTRGEREITLTSKEFDLLALLAAHPRQVMTRDKLMDAVWGYDYLGESNVLEVYIGYLRSKLEEGGESRLVHTVRGVGYVLKE